MKRPRLANGFRIDVRETYASMSRRAAQILMAELERKPDLLLCASAGGTPTETYRCLARRAARDPGRFAGLRVVQIDEWLGLPDECAATCAADLRSHLLEPLRIRGERYVGFTSHAADPQAECGRIQRWLAANGPIDICLLGLGLNGHVAMNEPAPAAVPHPHVATLAPSSRTHALLSALQRKPRYGLTLGMGDILRSRKILLLVSGARKRVPLARLMQPRVTPRFPASFLWLHADATVLCDREAAAQA